MNKEKLQTKLDELAKVKKEAIDAGNIEKASLIRGIEKKVKEDLKEINNDQADK